MARLQDFPSVTPTSSDKLLIVQSQGQGLASINSVINRPRQEITSQVTFTENISGTNTRIFYKNGMLYIFYQGESKTHTTQETLFTLPSGYRPPNLLYTPFVINNFGYGTIEMQTSGVVIITNITGGQNTGRVYFTVAIPLS